MRVFRRMHWNTILALLVVARSVEVDYNATSADLFLFKYERSKFIFMHSVPMVTRKRAEGTAITKSGHNEIGPVYSEEFADRVMSCDFAEWDQHLYIQSSLDFLDNRQFNAYYRVVGNCNSLVVSDGAKINFTPVEELNSYKHSEDLGDCSNWEFVGDIDGESTQRVLFTGKLQHLKHVGLTKKQTISANGTMEVELARGLVIESHVPVNASLSSRSSVIKIKKTLLGAPQSKRLRRVLGS